ncbi:acetate--CoA ligase family protein [Solicola gregarius]|uniref:Acetate--CoA ligase family protein n=1 Tax=Solicola gregarius TaxID=2908642 RepID=A0AA46TKJ8_9ACTN|nr:acetate--CoA ligase family protein [Solicola gregarius]UYM07029.1 acetate--CoA ligase family protein [Solicola gregarius]
MRRQGPPGASAQVSLGALFAPRTVAIVGASPDSAKWGHILSQRALASPGDRTILLINRHAREVLDQPTYVSPRAAAAAHDVRIDLAVLCVPASGFVAAVTDAVAAGARAIVGITAGLSEAGTEGARIEAEALAVARDAGAVLVGPNCLGVVDTSTGLQLAHATLPAGDVAVLSQSGNLVLDLAGLLAERGLGVSRFVSLGNQADLGLVDFLYACIDHNGTRAVAVYTEDVVDGRGFLDAARALRDAGKPLVLLAPGRTEAAIRSAVSHTGSLTSAAMVLDAACAAVGARRVEHPTQLADQLEALRSPRRMSGDRVAVLTDGGGHGAVAADALAAAGMRTPELTGELVTELRAALWARAAVANPVDLAGAGEQDAASYARGVALLLPSDQVDGVLLTGFFGGYSTEQSNLTEPELAAVAQVAATVAAQSKPLVVHTIYPDSPSAEALRAAGIPVYRDVDRACAVLAGLVEHESAGLAEPLPVNAAPVTDTSYDAARALFVEAGIAFPAAVSVTDAAGFEAALADLRFPIAMKATGRSHKSEGGGVVLGVADRDAARTAYDDLMARLAPPTVSVEEMADLTDGVELIVGSVRDPKFGPVVLVGLGGIFAEVLADTACAIAPTSPAAARRLLLSLRGAPLLLGARGRPAVDLDALAELVARVSLLASAHPEVAELELNPVLAGQSGVLALDARVVLEVAQVPLVETVDPGVLGREDAVIERP